MKQLILILTTSIFLTGILFQGTNIDPTGTYKLVSETIQKGDEVYGYTGQIQVKQLSEKKIIMTFEVNKGAPSYNSGSFVDTMDYHANKAVFTTPSIDSTCEITFQFTKKGITVKEKTASSSCGFGNAVVADGFFKKTSSATPVLRYPLTGKKIEE